MREKKGVRKMILYTALALAFFLPLSRAGISIFTGVLTLLWLIEGAFREKWLLLKKEPFFWMAAAFTGYMTLTLLWSADKVHGVTELLNYYYYFPLIVILFTSLRQKDAQKLLFAFLAGMLLSIIITYGIHFEWWHKRGIMPDNPTPFMHHIIYSVFLAVTGLLLLKQLLLENRVEIKALFWLLFFLFTVGAIIISWGRTGQVAFILGLFFLLLSYMKVSWKKLVFMSSIMVVLGMGIYTFSSQVQMRLEDTKRDFRALIEKGEYDTSIGGRIALDILSYAVIKEHLFLGAGVGDGYDAILSKTKEPPYQKLAFISRYEHPHNQYLEIMIQGGVVGLILFLALFYSLALRSRYDNVAASYTLILLVVYLISFFAEPVLRRQFGMALFALMAAIILLQSKKVSSLR